MTWTHQDTPTAVEAASNVASIAQTLGAGQAIGDLIVCQYTGDNNGSASDPGGATGLSDNQSMTWTLRATSWKYNTTSLQGVGCGDCVNVSSTTTSTVTVSYSGWTDGVADFAGIYCSRYRSSLGAGSFDKAAANSGNGTTASVTSTTPTNDNSLCHSQVTDGASETKPAGWTDRVTVTAGNNNATADLIQTTATATTASWTVTSGQWASNLVIYAEPVGAALVVPGMKNPAYNTLLRM